MIQINMEMTKPTIRKCLLAALDAMGAIQIESRGTKYVAFRMPEGDYYFVGRREALLHSFTRSMRGAYSFTGTSEHSRLIAEGRSILEGTP